MSQTPATTRKTFPEISSRAWEHPADRTALSALRRLKGFDQILKLMSGMLRERQHRLLYLASAARVGPRSSPPSTRCWTNAWMCWTRRRNPNST